jgi:hypothetical protein
VLLTDKIYEKWPFSSNTIPVFGFELAWVNVADEEEVEESRKAAASDIG